MSATSRSIAARTLDRARPAPASTQDLRETICQILAIPPDYADKFDILDQKGDREGLTLIQYRVGIDLADPITRTLRGVVLDVAHRTVLSTTSVYSVVCQAPEGRLEVEAGDVLLDTEFGPRRIPLANCQLMPHFEGAKLSIMLYDGEVFTMTHRNMYARGRVIPNYNERGDYPRAPSRWAPWDMPFTTQMDVILGDPYEMAAHLFPKGCRYSPFIYSFYVVHPSRRLVTTLETSEEGLVIFFGAFPMWPGPEDNASSPFDWSNDPADPRPKVGTPHLTPYVFGGERVYTSYPYDQVKPGNFILVPGEHSLSLEQANEFLSYGAMDLLPESRDLYDTAPDYRMVPAESVIVIYTPSDPNAVPEHFHVRSRSYSYRNHLHGSEFLEATNRYIYFCRAMEAAYLPMKVAENRDKFRDRLPPVKPAPRDILRPELERGEVVSWADLYTDAELARLSRDQMLLVAAYAYLLATNPHFQLMAFRFYDRYIYDLQALADWMVRIKDRQQPPKTLDGEVFKPPQLDVWDKQVQRVLKQARDRYRKSGEARLRDIIVQERKRSGIRSRSVPTPDEILIWLIRRQVAKQHGDNLYRMLRLMREVTGHNSKRISDPTAPIVERRKAEHHFPPLPAAASSSLGPSAASSSRPAPPVRENLAELIDEEFLAGL